ncbi:methyltransferase domain-containing protein [Ectopseudomonas mendocina]|uniref:Methyltransferase domain-containing protein n=1 Tax=Ectopseudomonas mendocina TaxID=300 RepID=A0ABZ2RNB0_ECTME
MALHTLSSADKDWLTLNRAARDWLAGPLGQLLLTQEQPWLEEELARLFGGFLLHYGPAAEKPPQPGKIQRSVRLGAPFSGVDIVCEDQAWPVSENSADAVLLQHGLDFSLVPHGLLREAARGVRPGGHLLIVGINPSSLWGARHYLSRGGLRKARCISPERITDWLNVLGFVLEKRRFGCYRPPLSSLTWQHRLAPLERLGQSWNLPGAGFYLLVARKLVRGVRPNQVNSRQPLGKLLPMPVAQVSRYEPRQSENCTTKRGMTDT